MTIILSSRLTWVREYLAGHCTGVEAAAHLQLSCRQFRRYQTEGPAGLQHRLRGRPSNHRATPKLKERALALYARHYFDCGPALAAELLAERHQLAVHPETLRLWLRAAHFGTHSRRRQPHRQRRERMPAFGQMLQLDGSPHRWFGHSSACLLNLIDDASSLNLCRFDPSAPPASCYGTGWPATASRNPSTATAATLISPVNSMPRAASSANSANASASLSFPPSPPRPRAASNAPTKPTSSV